MPIAQPLPGTTYHQSLLKTIVGAYRHDTRIRALVVFGSLGRGNWDAYSDLDLAVIVRDDAQVDVPGELHRLEYALVATGETPLVATAAGNSVYLALDSLTGIAVDYHALAAASPYLQDGCVVLWGELDAATIYDAARANEQPQPPLDQELRRALWLALGVDVPLQRGQFWSALNSLEKLRGALVAIFAVSRGGARHNAFFETEAGAELRTKLGQTLPAYVPDSPAATTDALASALLAALDLLEFDLETLSNRKLQLGSGERAFIRRLRVRAGGATAVKTAAP